MAQIKYFAAGFMKDAEILLKDFVQRNSMEFPVFAEIWKKHDFSLIYAGRSSKKELAEFTQEIFNLSANYLTSSSLLYQVGGIYLLYSLYRNQILSPPVKIRILLEQFKNLLTFQNSQHRTLCYVIDYLIKNSLEFVACPNIMGPTIPVWSEDQKQDPSEPKAETALKSDIAKIASSNTLKEIDEMLTQYVEIGKRLKAPIVSDTKICAIAECMNAIDELVACMGEVDSVTTIPVNNAKSSLRKKKPRQNNIGSRRALLKALAFAGVSTDGSNVESCSENEDVSEMQSEPLIQEIPVTKRIARRGKRKVGRPKKCISEEVSVKESGSNVNRQCDEITKSPVTVRKRRKKRNPEYARSRHYYMDKSSECESLKLSSYIKGSDILPKNEECTSGDDEDSLPELEDFHLMEKEDIISASDKC